MIPSAQFIPHETRADMHAPYISACSLPFRSRGYIRSLYKVPLEEKEQ